MTYIWPATDDTGDNVFASVHMIHDKLFFFLFFQDDRFGVNTPPQLTSSCSRPMAACPLFGIIMATLLYGPNEYYMFRQSHQFKAC